jgi:hypothetical protein
MCTPEEYLTYGPDTGKCPICGKRLTVICGIRVKTYLCDCEPFGYHVTAYDDLTQEEADNLINRN